jgi:hypothetical protein
MQSDLLDGRSGRAPTWAALFLPLAIGAVAVGATATDTVPLHPAHAAQVHVAIVAKGDVGQYAGMCGSRAGTDSLDGILGLMDLDDDGSALYAGKLTRFTEVDACGPSQLRRRIRWSGAYLSGLPAPMDNLSRDLRR